MNSSAPSRVHQLHGSAHHLARTTTQIAAPQFATSLEDAGHRDRRSVPVHDGLSPLRVMPKDSFRPYSLLLHAAVEAGSPRSTAAGSRRATEVVFRARLAAACTRGAVPTRAAATSLPSTSSFASCAGTGTTGRRTCSRTRTASTSRPTARRRHRCSTTSSRPGRTSQDRPRPAHSRSLTPVDAHGPSEESDAGLSTDRAWPASITLSTVVVLDAAFEPSVSGCLQHCRHRIHAGVQRQSGLVEKEPQHRVVLGGHGGGSGWLASRGLSPSLRSEP